MSNNNEPKFSTTYVSGGALIVLENSNDLGFETCAVSWITKLANTRSEYPKEHYAMSVFSHELRKMPGLTQEESILKAVIFSRR